LPPMGRLQVTGEVSRATDTPESIRGSVDLQSEKLGQFSAEGVLGEQWKIGSQLELEFKVDRLSKASALLPISLQGDVPLQAQAIVRTDGETLQVTELKVMSFNLWHGFGQINDGYRKGLEAIILSDVDIVGTQETVANQTTGNYQVQQLQI